MKKTLLVLALTTITVGLFAQKKTTTSATVSFDATTSIDNLPKADNKTSIASLDPKTGAVAVESTVKNFAFSNPTLQTHFNGENWLNSDKFPTFTFKGTIANPSSIDFAKNGNYTSDVEGTLSIKGVEQKVKAPVTVVVKDGVVSTSTSFSFKLADFGIYGAPIDAGKVAKEPKVTFAADFK